MRVAFHIVMSGAALAATALALGPTRQALTTLAGTPGPSGPDAINAALAAQATTLVSSPSCGGGDAVTAIDAATGALQCDPVSAALTDLTGTNGLVVSGSGTTRTVSVTGAYSGSFTALNSAASVTIRENDPGTPARLAFVDNSSDPGYWVFEATHQAGGVPADATLAFKFKEPLGDPGFTAATIDGAGGYTTNGELYVQSIVTQSLSETGNQPGRILFVENQTTTGHGLQVQGRVDLIGAAGMTGTVTNGKGFATYAAPSGSGTETASYTAANPVRLPVYRVEKSFESTTDAASCSTGDLAISGGCDAGAAGYVISHSLTASSYSCTFSDAAGNKAAAICLKVY